MGISLSSPVTPKTETTASPWNTIVNICSSIGGRAEQHSDGGIHILDCPVWTPAAAALLHYECPTATVTVESSMLSLSGFAIIIRKRHSTARVARRLCMAAISSLLLFTCIWFTFGMKVDLEHGTRLVLTRLGEHFLLHPSPNASFCSNNDNNNNNNNNNNNKHKQST